MKTSNYLAKLPQEAIIRQVQTFRDYDLITLDLPAPRQRLCPHCAAIDCVIKDSGSWQTVRHIPSHHRGTAVSFHKRRLYCKTCRSTFYENPYWVHPSLHMTQALYDSILLDLTEPSPSPRLPGRTALRHPSSSLSLRRCVSVYHENSRKPSASMNSKETTVFGVPNTINGGSANFNAASPMTMSTPSLTSCRRPPALP